MFIYEGSTPASISPNTVEKKSHLGAYFLIFFVLLMTSNAASPITPVPKEDTCPPIGLHLHLHLQLLCCLSFQFPSSAHAQFAKQSPTSGVLGPRKKNSKGAAGQHS